MHYFYLEPEVSGELGKETIINTTIYPPKIQKLNYEFSSWLGDDLIESFPCYIISEHLARNLKNSNLSGFILDDVLITKSKDFDEISTIKHLVKFYWLKVTGKPFKDDISISEDNRLFVNEKALMAMQSFNLKYADIETISNNL